MPYDWRIFDTKEHKFRGAYITFHAAAKRAEEMNFPYDYDRFEVRPNLRLAHNRRKKFGLFGA